MTTVGEEAGAGLTVELAPTFDAVAALAPEWDALFARAPDATPFQASACLLPWARHHAPDRLAAAVVREGGRLIGLLPLFSWEGRVLIAGTGPTDYNDGLFELGRADAAALALGEAARLSEARGCGTVMLDQLRPGALLLDVPAPPGWRARTEAAAPCPIATVIGPDGLGAMPDKWAKKLAYALRKAERAGGVPIARATGDAVPEAVAALLDLHARRWAAQGEAGVLGDPLMRAFLADALPALEAAGLLRLWTLAVEGETAAVVCGLQAHGALHFYLQGVDPARLGLSPGTLLIAHAIQAATAEGVSEIHFLRGEEPYKAHWGAVTRPTWRRVLERG